MRAIAFVLLLASCTTATVPPPAPVEPVAPAAPTTIAVPLPPILPDVQTKREQELAAARSAYEANPNDADALIWLGRRTAYLGRYQEAIDIFTEGIRKHPRDARMLRHRGHRYLSTRQYAKAEADLKKGWSMVRGKPDQVEPDGLPNARNIPTSTLQSNLLYHLGLARYLQGDFAGARDAYVQALKVARNPDHLVSTSHWLYMSLRRLNRGEEAEKVADAISHDMEVIENEAYHKLMLMYRGDIAPEELAAQDPDTVDGATILYGVANWYSYNGDAARARSLLQKLTAGKQTFAFAYLAAEADLARTK
ncbi:MAG TPA: tetratricopeptide repeat protein [Thermoanaerobaculia bacterium]|jgi:tetratricopeptide (TPR) repeat protein